MTIFRLDENTTCDPANGILSCKEVPFAELDDETLQCMYEYNADGPAFVLKIRPDWVKKYHPELLN